jgi:predicted chitinase
VITSDILRRMWPRAPQAKIDAICSIAAEEFAYHGITEARVVVQLMANISHENGAGTIIRENGNYSAPRIVQVFGPGKSSARVTEAEAQQLAHNPRALFERVYNLPGSPKLAKDLGNKAPGDGFKYRGGGDLQLTGRANYERIGELTGHTEIILNPDALADPAISFRVAVAEFVHLGCVPWAKQGNTTQGPCARQRRQQRAGRSRDLGPQVGRSSAGRDACATRSARFGYGQAAPTISVVEHRPRRRRRCRVARDGRGRAAGCAREHGDDDDGHHATWLTSCSRRTTRCRPSPS